MYGVVEKTAAMAKPSGLKVTSSAAFTGNVAGLAYFVPKPAPAHG
jgi:hypothetical protein